MCCIPVIIRHKKSENKQETITRDGLRLQLREMRMRQREHGKLRQQEQNERDSNRRVNKVREREKIRKGGSNRVDSRYPVTLKITPP